MKAYIGIDLGGTTAKFGLFDEKGKLCKSVSIPTGKAKAQDTLIHEMAVRIRSFLKRRGLYGRSVGRDRHWCAGSGDEPFTRERLRQSELGAGASRRSL